MVDPKQFGRNIVWPRTTTPNAKNDLCQEITLTDTIDAILEGPPSAACRSQSYLEGVLQYNTLFEFFTLKEK